MAKFEMPEIKNYGMATMGERGQVVMPKAIRQKMKLKSGDKFLVFSKDDMVIAFIKPENFDKIISEFTSHFEDLKKIKK
jgi:AbrB family looped-hinge helix DNA binding protein